MSEENATGDWVTDVLNAAVEDKGLDAALRKWYGRYKVQGSFAEPFVQWVKPKIIFAAQQIQSGEGRHDIPAIVEALRLNANAAFPWLDDILHVMRGRDGVLEADRNSYVEEGDTVASLWARCGSEEAAASTAEIVKATMESHGFSVEVLEDDDEGYEITVYGTRKFGNEVEQ